MNNLQETLEELQNKINRISTEHERKDLQETLEELTELLLPAKNYCGDYPAPCNCDDPTTHKGHS